MTAREQAERLLAEHREDATYPDSCLCEPHIPTDGSEGHHAAHIAQVLDEAGLLASEQGSWVCGRCGRGPEEHVTAACVYDPVFRAAQPAAAPSEDVEGMAAERVAEVETKRLAMERERNHAVVRAERAEATLREVRLVERNMAEQALQAWQSADARRGLADHAALEIYADALTRWSERLRLAFSHAESGLRGMGEEVGQ